MELRVQQHRLQVKDLSVQVHLGCTAEERLVPQEVRLTCEARFGEPPDGIKSDKLDETLCYAKICDALRTHCESGEFQLIERLATECLEILQRLSGEQAKTALAVHKVRPPVRGLLGGTIYQCGDFLL